MDNVCRRLAWSYLEPNEGKFDWEQLNAGVCRWRATGTRGFVSEQLSRDFKKAKQAAARDAAFGVRSPELSEATYRRSPTIFELEHDSIVRDLGNGLPHPARR